MGFNCTNFQNQIAKLHTVNAVNLAPSEDMELFKTENVMARSVTGPVFKSLYDLKYNMCIQVWKVSPHHWADMGSSEHSTV